MSDTLGPVEVEFTIPADFGKDADAAIKKMAGLTDAATKMPKSVKAALLEEKDVIKTIEADIKQLEKTLQNVAPGKAKQSILGDLAAAKRALEEEKAALKGLETQSESTSQGSRRLTYVLRDMQDQLAKMRIAGQQNTEEYRNMELSAAKLSDELRDVRAVTKELGDDQRVFKGMADGITGIAGAASAAVGGVALFAGENENLQKIQTRVQALMAITIGLQQVSSALDKDSAFMTVTVVKAKEMWVTAEKALTVALWGSNIAAKALMASLTLGLAIAVPALISMFDKLATKREEARKADIEAAKVTAEANIAAGKARIEVDLTIAKLANYKGSKEGEKAIVDEVNKKYGESFGTYKTLGEWLDKLKEKSASYVQVMFLQAKSQALINKALRLDEQVNTVTTPAYLKYKEEQSKPKNTKPGTFTVKDDKNPYSGLFGSVKQIEDERDGVLDEIDKVTEEIQKVVDKSGLNKPQVTLDKPAKEAKSEEQKTYYLDLLEEFKSYQEKREDIVFIYNLKIRKLEETNQAEKAQIAKEARDKELKELDDAQAINIMLQKYKTYDDQIAEIRAKSDEEIIQLKSKGYNEQAKMAQELADKEVTAIEEQKVKSLDAFAGLFDDIASLSADQIKKLIWEANQNFDKLNPEELVIVTAQLEKLGLKLQDLGKKGKKDEITDPFRKLADAVRDLNAAASDEGGKILENAIVAAAEAAQELIADLNGITGILESVGAISKDQADATRQTLDHVSGVVNGLGNIGKGILNLDPASVVKGAIQVVGNAIKLLDFKGNKIAKNQASVAKEIGNMERAYKKLDQAVQNSLGEDKYKLQTQQYKLNVDEMAKYQELIDLENKKKKRKRDQGAIEEWKNAIAELEGANIDIENSITESLAQTNAHDFASQIGDSIVSAFQAGTDATIAWGEVTNQVMRNAVVNALKLKYLEKPIQEAVDAIAAGLKNDSYLSADEVAAIRKIVDEPAALMNEALQTMPELFGTDPKSSTDSPAKKASFTSLKEETESALLGQFTALRMSSAIMADIAKEEQYVRKSMSLALQAIAENTSYCRKLENIDRTLKTIETDGIKVR